MAEKKNKNIKRKEELKEAKNYVLESHIYSQKMPFTYTIFTKQGIYALIGSFIVARLLYLFFDRGLWEAYFLAFYGISLFYIYRKKIKITYSDIYTKVFIFKKAQMIVEALKDELKKKRLSLFFIFLLMSNFTYYAHAEMQDAVEDYTDESKEFLKWYENEEKEKKLQKKSEELKKMKSDKFKQLNLDSINILLEKEVELKSNTMNE